MRGKLRNNLMLMLAAFIWGSAFVAQSAGMDYIGPFTFNSVRCLLGAVVLLPVIKVMDWQKDKAKVGKTGMDKQEGKTPEEKKDDSKMLLIGGICCGVVLAAASSLQQLGLVYTSAGKAGFITALYILIVPIIRIFFGKKAGIKVWIGIALAIVGMYFLCITEGFHIGTGDLLVFFCSLVFSLHILVIDYFSPKADGVRLSCVQFLVCGGLCAVPMLLLEKPSIEGILAAWLPIAYTGVLSCGVAYTLQIIVQKSTDPTVTALVMSMESVFAAVTGWLILHERLSMKEMLGCVLVFAAIILAQLPDRAAGKETAHQKRSD